MGQAFANVATTPSQPVLFQDLPVSKYPRSYTPEFESKLAMQGALSEHGSPGGVPGPKSLPSAGYLNTYKDNIQAGELATSEDSQPTSYPHIPNWEELRRIEALKRRR
jgi:hypothetical protein